MVSNPTPEQSSAQNGATVSFPEQSSILKLLVELEKACVALEAALGWVIGGDNLTNLLVLNPARRRQHDLETSARLREEAVLASQHWLEQLREERTALIAQVENSRMRLAEAQQQAGETRREARDRASNIIEAARKESQEAVDAVVVRRDGLLAEKNALESLLAGPHRTAGGPVEKQPKERRKPAARNLAEGSRAAGGQASGARIEDETWAGRPVEAFVERGEPSSLQPDTDQEMEKQPLAEAGGPESPITEEILTADEAPVLGEETSAPSAILRTSRVILSGLTAFSPALEFERGVRAVRGVRQVNAVRLQEGTLELRVQYLDREALESGLLAMPRLEVAKEQFDDDELKVRFIRAGANIT